MKTAKASLTPTLRRRLIAKAKAVSKNAYAPYSKFSVGAAILTRGGKIFTGCNVENASYGLTNCAERSAIFAAASEGHREIVAVAIYTPTETPTMPCGACRQVINEFGPGALVISSCKTGETIEVTLPALLPAAFGPHDLK